MNAIALIGLQGKFTVEKTHEPAQFHRQLACGHGGVCDPTARNDLLSRVEGSASAPLLNSEAVDALCVDRGGPQFLLLCEQL